MSRIARIRRRARRFAFWGLAGLSLLVAHDLVILAQLGPGAEVSAALRSGAHGYWGAASAAIVLVALAAAGVATWRIVRLRHRVAALDPMATPRPRRPSARIFGLWLRLFPVVAAGFALQENVEHFIGHGHAPGAGALLGPEYPLALPVIGLITLVASVIGAATVAVEDELVAVIIAALSTRPRAPRSLRRPPAHLLHPRCSPVGWRGAGRAPPAPLVPAT